MLQPFMSIWSIILLVFILSVQTHANDGISEKERIDQLLVDLHALESNRVQSVDSLSFSVNASEENQLMQSRASFILPNVSFDIFSKKISSTAVWCEVLLLHLNVKSCTYRTLDEGAEIDLYLGRKHYQEPPEATRITFQFSTQVSTQVARIELTAESGPYGTSKYKYVSEAIPTNDGIFFVLRLSNHNGTAGRLVDLYLSTLARSKVGFSIDGTTFFGKPSYVKGQLGAAERNIVRYMLALQVSLAALDIDFFKRANLWFDETEQFPKQLREMSKKEYLKIKMQEFENQQLLQNAMENNTDVVWSSTQKKNDR